MRKIAITGIRKAAESVRNYLGRKSLKVVARANRTADKAYDAIGRGASRAADATANLVRKAARVGDAFDQAAFGATGKATRNASAAVIKATRHARPRARETMGQINRRKGIVNKVYYPSKNEMNAYKNSGFPKVRDFPKTPRTLKGMKTLKGDHMFNVRPPRGAPREANMREIKAPDNIGDFQKYYKAPAFDRSKLSYEDIKPMGRSGPRYTSKQVRAGKKVALGAAAGYAASQYFKDKKSNR
jgi:hypothetical protein